MADTDAAWFGGLENVLPEDSPIDGRLQRSTTSVSRVIPCDRFETLEQSPDRIPNRATERRGVGKIDRHATCEATAKIHRTYKPTHVAVTATCG